MSDFKSDLPYVKWGLTALLLGLAASGTAIFLSQDYVGHAQQTHLAAQRELADARHGLDTAVDDRRNMASYAQEYAMLLKRNIIGSENRLDWLDGLERLRHRNLVMDFNYTISPQKPYKPPLQVDNGNFDLMRSDMSLSFKLLHEGQLIDFLNALRTDVNGWFVVDNCATSRNKTGDGENAAVPQLKAECKGGWLTLKKKGVP